MLMGAQPSEHAFRHHAGDLRIGAWEQHGKFFTAQPSDDTVRADCVRQCCRDLG